MSPAPKRAISVPGTEVPESKIAKFYLFREACFRGGMPAMGVAVLLSPAAA
jgi:hypothetical protein